MSYKVASICKEIASPFIGIQSKIDCHKFSEIVLSVRGLDLELKTSHYGFQQLTNVKTKFSLENFYRNQKDGGL